MRKGLFVIPGLLLLISLSLASTVYAGSGSYSGTNVGGGSWHRPFADGTCCSRLGPVLYHTQAFFVGTTGNYAVSSIQPGWDGYIFVYSGSFDPLNQTANFVAGDDDGNGGIGTSDIASVPLSVGITYYLVTTAFENGEEGTFTNTVSGPGTVTFGIPASVAVVNSLDVFNPGDDRINHHAIDRAAPVAIYCQSYGIQVYDVDGYTGKGSNLPIISLSYEEIAAMGVPTDSPLLLAESGDTTLWRLTTGEFQVNAYYDVEWKPWAFLWDACPMTSGRHLNN
ncbi:MAG TPA: hypothetical protein PLQ56_22050 [Aggregatilineales bacterium]|nr:hypothetical protein [Aggregatilineales bacterium]